MTLADSADAAPRVMLVDDHTVFAELLADAMRRQGFDTTVVAADPTAVSAATSAQRFDLAVLDVSFGEGNTDGIALIGGIRETGSRVIMLTGSDEPFVHARCLREGASSVIRKGQPFARLLDAVEAAARNRSVHAADESQRMIRELERHEAERAERLRPFESLTPREEQVLLGLTQGLNATELAQQGFVSLATVRAQVHSILTKLGAHSQLAAVAAARAAGWEPTTPGPATTND